MAMLLQNEIANNNNIYMNQSIKEYVKYELSQGLTLAKSVSNIISYDDGCFYVIKNDSLFKLDANHESDFIHGSIVTAPVIEEDLPDGRRIRIRRNYAAKDSAVRLARIAYMYIERQIKDGIGLIVVENANAQNGDPWLKKSPQGIYVHEDEVYHVLDENVSVKSIAESIIKADSGWMTVGFVTSSWQFNQESNSSVLSKEIIEEMASNVRIVFARAFDMEGYALWCQDKEFTPNE